MRPLETLLLVLLALRIGWRHVKRPSQVQVGLDLLTGGILLVGLLHLILEGYRWQMVPLYLAAVLCSLPHLLYTRRRPSDGGRAKWIWTILILLLLVVAAAPSMLFPVPSVPEPTGPYAIGTLSFQMVDNSRNELYSDDPTDPRELMIQVWYPAEPSKGARPGPWMATADRLSRPLSEWFGLPSFFLDHIQYAGSNSYPEAPFAPGSSLHPVLLFSHGWGGFRIQNSYQMEELASHGYVVAAADHTYAAVAVAFPDGRLLLQNENAMTTDSPASAQLLGSQWAADMAFVLDHLETLNADDPESRFTGRLDLDKIGALGHSTGAGAAIVFCAQDSRCRAVLAMDPYMRPVTDEMLDNGLPQPILALWSELWSGAENSDRYNRLAANLTGEAYSAVIAGTMHHDFADLPMLTPLASTMGLKGPIPGDRGLRIIRGLSVAFLDDTLRGGADRPLEAVAADYPEVTLPANPPVND